MEFKQRTGIPANERYRGPVKLYLESGEDVFVILKWFPKLPDRISVESAEPTFDDDRGGGGGCEVVIAKVGAARSETPQIKAFGIVDRDVLLARNHPAWSETDDAAFHAAEPLGPEIHVLNRWELENFLLHPSAIHRVLENKTLGRSGISEADVVNALNAAEEDFISVSTIDILSRQATPPKPSPGEGFDWNKEGNDLRERVRTQTSASVASFDAAADSIRKFAEELPPGAERWDRLSRMLDGKRVLARLKALWRDGFSSPKTDRGALAEHVKEYMSESALGRFVDTVYANAI